MLLLALFILLLATGKTIFKDYSWVVPIIEAGIALYVLSSIARSIVRHNNTDDQDFTVSTRRVLESRLGKGFLVEIVLTELRVFYYAVGVWFRKPREQTQGTYTYYKSSQVKTVVIVFSILLVGEGALFHYLLQLWSEAAAWIITVFNVYALMYMMGLYNSSKYIPHRINAEKLVINLGLQGSIEVELSNIKSIQKAKEPAFGVKLPKETFYALLKIDSPQYEISLKEPSLVHAPYGRSKPVTSVIFRADEPNYMIEAIHSKMIIEST